HMITASYSSAGHFAPSTSNTVSQVVDKANTTTTVMTSGSPSIFGTMVTFTATVSDPITVSSDGNPITILSPVTEGTVTFTDGVGGPMLAGPLTLDSSGHASFTTNILTAGTHEIVAIYSGSSNYNP